MAPLAAGRSRLRSVLILLLFVLAKWPNPLEAQGGTDVDGWQRRRAGRSRGTGQCWRAERAAGVVWRPRGARGFWDTWEWDGTQWLLQATTRPGPQIGHALARTPEPTEPL